MAVRDIDEGELGWLNVTLTWVSKCGSYSDLGESGWQYVTFTRVSQVAVTLTRVSQCGFT